MNFRTEIEFGAKSNAALFIHLIISIFFMNKLIYKRFVTVYLYSLRAADFSQRNSCYFNNYILINISIIKYIRE